jgi:mannosylglucosylglycerate synthase
VNRPSVAILHFTSPPVVGGVESLVGIHAALLADRGYPVRVISGRGDQFRPDVPVNVIPGLYSKDPELLAINEELDRGEAGERFEAMAQRMYQALRAALAGVDVAIVHNAFTLHFNLPLTVALHWMVERGEGPIFVSWCHDLSWTNPLYIPKMRQAFPWRLLKEPLERVDYVVVSETRREELAGLFGWPGERLRVVPAGVDLATQLRLDPATVELADRLGLLDSDLLALAPVRITKRKNLELGIRIARALVDLGVQARLLVTGPPGPHNIRSGDYVSELRQLRRELEVEREVVLLFEHVGGEARRPEHDGSLAPEASSLGGDGAYPISDRMLYDLYSLSDLMLFSSSQEGFGIPLLEAGLFKLPVFCSNIPPFREIGADAVHYFELDEDPAAIAARIRDWMERDEVHRLRRRVLSGYTWESIFRDRIEPLVAGRYG